MTFPILCQQCGGFPIDVLLCFLSVPVVVPEAGWMHVSMVYLFYIHCYDAWSMCTIIGPSPHCPHASHVDVWCLPHLLLLASGVFLILLLTYHIGHG